LIFSSSQLDEIISSSTKRLSAVCLYFINFVELQHSVNRHHEQNLHATGVRSYHVDSCWQVFRNGTERYK